MVSDNSSASDTKTVVIVGGGFSGALFGLKLHLAKPAWRIVIVEPSRQLGRGIAYGACAPEHRLNVPVSRMELGLEPGFANWLSTDAAREAQVLAGASDKLQDGFAPRILFGDYMQERIETALRVKGRYGLHAMRGKVVRLLGAPRRGVLLTDGREVEADLLVLAMGNLPPRPPGGPDRWLYDTGYFVSDPWAPNALEDIAPSEAVLLIGTGLTMVDVALHLKRNGHRGPVLAVSRRGLLPTVHKAGGIWPAFLEGKLPASPRQLLRIFREQVTKSTAKGIPWQRVFDAARPVVPAIWNEWAFDERLQFLRHLRPRWDIHRHRMAPEIAAELDELLSSGGLKTLAGRIAKFNEQDGAVDVTLHRRGGGSQLFAADSIINCTGPGGDFDRIAIPLIANLREQGLGVADDLGIGLQTDDCAVLDATGHPSKWLFALGPLTRPAWWEIVAVPEIALQIDRLVAQFAAGEAGRPPRLTSGDFLGIGDGI